MVTKATAPCLSSRNGVAGSPGPLLSMMESKIIATMENNEAREALNSVVATEERTREMLDGTSTSTWAGALLVGVIVGLGAFFLLQEQWWGFIFLPLAMVAIVLLDKRSRSVRYSVKQEVRPDDNGMKPFYESLAIVAVSFAVFRLLPRGDVFTSAIGGVVVGVLYIALYVINRRRAA